MNRIPAWAWSLLTIIIILLALSIGGRGPEGRAVSRMLFPFAAVAVVTTTLLSFWRERVIPTGKKRLINIAAVGAIMYLTIPIWHFGVELPETQGDPVTVRWWVNGVVLALAAVLYFVLSRFFSKTTQSLNDDD